MSITIGTVSLQSFEVPASIHFGGSQRIAIHRLGNGQRVIDTLGHENLDVAFSGVLSGPGAASRATLLDNMCANASAIPLAWDDYYLSVIIKTFDANYATGTWIPYSLTCVVASSDTDDQTPMPSNPIDDVYADLASAGAVDSPWVSDIAMATSLLSSVVATGSSEAFRTTLASLLSQTQAATDGAAPAQLQAVASLVAAYLRRALVNLSAGGY